MRIFNFIRDVITACPRLQPTQASLGDKFVIVWKDYVQAQIRARRESLEAYALWDEKSFGNSYDNARFIMQTVTFIVGLSTAESTATLITHMTQYILGISPSGQSVVEFLTAAASVQENESTGSTFLTSVKGIVQKLRIGVVGIADTPAARFIGQIFVLANWLKVTSGKTLDFKGYEVLSEKFFDSVSSQYCGIADLALDAFSFVLDAFAYTSLGESLSWFVSPRTTLAEYSKLMAMLPRFNAGQLSEVSNMTEAQYLVELEVVHERLQRMSKQKGGNIYVNMIKDICSAITDVKMRVKSLQFRKVPLCVSLSGKPGVGKSVLIDSMCAQFTHSFDVPTAFKYRAYPVATDAYDGSITGETTVIVLDDLGATKSQYAKIHPNELLIRFVNNVPNFAVKARIEEKDTIPIKPEFVFVTTNDPWLGLASVTDSPGATFRRLHVKVDIEIKPEFALPHGEVDIPKVERAGLRVEDVQLFTFYDMVETQRADGKRSTKTHYPQTLVPTDGPFKGRKLEKVSYKDFVSCYMWMSVQHRERQERLLEDMKKTSHQQFLCKECYHWQCQCDKKQESEDEVADNEFASFIALSVSQYLMGWVANGFHDMLAMMHMDVLVELLWSYLASFVEMILGCYTRRLRSLLLRLAIYSFFYVGIVYLLWWRFGSSFCELIVSVQLVVLTCLGGLLLDYRNKLRSTMFTRTIINYLRPVEIYRNTLMRFGALGFAIMMGYRILAWAPILTNQSFFGTSKVETPLDLPEVDTGLNSTDTEVVKERSQRENMWVTAPKEDVKPCNPNSTSEQILAKVKKNTVRLVAKGKASTSVNCSTQGFSMGGKTFVVPTHWFENIDIGEPLQLIRGPHVTQQANPVIVRHRHIKGDLTIVTFTNCPEFPDMHGMLPSKNIRQTACYMITRDRVGEIQTQHLLWKQGKVQNRAIYDKGLTVDGGQYLAQTEKGFCCSPVLSVGHKVILGFHLGGLDGRGMAQTLLREQMENEMDIVGEPRIECIQTDFYGTDIISSAPLPERSVLRYMPHDRALGVQYVHSTVCSPPRLQSRVRATTLSPYLEREARPRLHGPPRYSRWKCNSETFHRALAPIASIRHDMLNHCINDYLSCLRFAHVPVRRPLSEFEMVNGIEGSTFVKGLNMKSSGGLGLTGPKAQYFTVEECPDTGRKLYYITPEIRSEVNRYVDLMQKGIRVMPVAVPCPKDEPTKTHKIVDGQIVENTKVRLFTVLPLAFNLVIRKYCLPVVDYIMKHPIPTECGVGIQTCSREWTELANYVFGFGDDRIFAGDYSAYDQRISQQFIQAVGEIFRHIAMNLGYTQMELDIVSMIFVELSNPRIIFGSAAVLFQNYNTSGNSITVFINNIVNSLLHRFVFFSANPTHWSSSFRDYVRFMGYGDDSIGTSSSEIHFDMQIISSLLKQIKMPYTDPKKSSIVPRFVPRDEVTFCKRYFASHEMTDYCVAPLEVESLYKALHNTMAHGDDALDTELGTIVDQLRELALHSRETFNQEHKIIRKCLISAELYKWRPEYEYTYDDWWDFYWRDKFDPPELDTLEGSIPEPLDHDGPVYDITEVFSDEEVMEALG